MKSTRRPKRRGSQTGARPRRRHGFPGANAPGERAAKHATETVEPERVEPPGNDGFAPADGGQPELDHAAANQAAEEILGANPLIGFDRAELFDALGRFVRLLDLYP